MLPDGWKQTTVGEACRIKNNQRFPLSAEQRAEMKGDYPYFGPTGVLDYLDHYRIDDEFALIGEDGDHFLKYGEREMTVFFSGKANVNNHAHIVGNSESCFAKWFYYALMHRDLTPVLSRQGVGRYKLTKAGLEKIEILLPPPDEQRRVIALLDIWNDAIATTQKLLANSRRQKRALMRQLLTGKHRLPGFSGEWRQYRLGKLFKERVENSRGDLPLLSITRDEGVIPRGDVGRKDTSNEDKSKYLRICSGDIGYNTMRMWQGVSALSAYEGIISPAYTVLVPQAQMDGRFSAYLFKFKPVVFLFYRYSQGLVSDTWNLKYPHFAKIKVFIPERQEQEAIAEVLAAADEEIAIRAKELKGLQEEKRALMQQLLTGKRRVRLPVSEAARS